MTGTALTLAAGGGWPAAAAAPAAVVAEFPDPPADRTTEHMLDLPGRTLRFAATAGTLRLFADLPIPDQAEMDQPSGTPAGGSGPRPLAEVAYIAFGSASPPPGQRPVIFVFNGGPGQASGWLNAGAIGPWIVPLGDSRRGTPEPRGNPDTWLDVTDLVFVDPAGTGYSRVLGGKAARAALWSVKGDIAALARVVRLWLERNDRMTSPVYLLGESYGGFRMPLLARALQKQESVAVAGLVMASPVLDFAWRAPSFNPLPYVTRLPSMAAAARALRREAVSRAALEATEEYAAGPYLSDLMRGERDAAAIARRSREVAALTGLDPALVLRHHGELSTHQFLRALFGPAARMGSIYDALVTSADPFPLEDCDDVPDPVLEGWTAPIAAAMTHIYAAKLHWQPPWTYRLSNREVFRSWNWGNTRDGPEALTSLAEALSPDPRPRALIVHGFYDLITPYFGTVLQLRQLQNPDIAGRIRLAVYPGGHLFYADAASRAAFRADARRLIEEE